MSPHSAPRQPLLDDAVIALHAPTQVWSGRDGNLGAAPIDGAYHGDVRHIRTVRVSVEGTDIETISRSTINAATVEFGGLLRGLDDDLADPKVRLLRRREVSNGRLHESLQVLSHRSIPLTVRLQVRLEPDFSPMQDVKAGVSAAASWTWDAPTATASDGHRGFRVTAPEAAISTDADGITLAWDLDLTRTATAFWDAHFHDSTLVVSAATTPAAFERPATTDPLVGLWLDRALDDLTGLRLSTPANPVDVFFAAGAPWFFTLFGRDSLWAARLALTVDPTIAASTLRVLARLQGTKRDPLTAEAPGKMPHELRSAPLALPNEGVHLPPLYYGTVDATPLWVCLLADAHAAGMALSDVRDLLPALRGALRWMTEDGSATGTGFIDYVDESGHGLANQGWKDSGDSIQWRDGRLAEGPIALCEVQGYAYEAAMRGADLLDELAEPGGSDLRAWAADLRDRFRAAYWVTTPEGHYPGIALDAHGDAVDTLTSNIGHLIGTGILTAEEERACADLLLGPSMSSGFGIRTMSTGAAGYWPLSYHGGSVWAHDTAISVHGMLRAGLTEPARAIAHELTRAAAGFAFRMPELHAGDGLEVTPQPTPYPASCRPQAWSAAAAVVVAHALAT